MRAYQIMDFNNPLSVYYQQHSAQALAPLSDLIQIVPVQCTTPATMPADILLNDKKRRTDTEKAALISHYNLAKKLAQGEEFIILEHDAYLWPEREKDFRLLFEYVHCPIWNCGIAAECYTTNKEVAKFFCELVENDHTHGYRGPLAIMHAAANKYGEKNKTNVVWIVEGLTNQTCVASSCNEALLKKGEVYDAPITQHVVEKTGSTIQRIKKPISRSANPNVFFT